jgi:hypothetical protein
MWLSSRENSKWRIYQTHSSRSAGEHVSVERIRGEEDEPKSC